jgi:PiT family inorganic phosphate transporter
LQELGPGGPPADSRAAVTQYIRTKQLQPDSIPAVAELVGEIDAQVNEYGTLRRIPTAAVNNVRNDMYLVSEAIRVMMNTGVPALDVQTRQSLVAYKGELDDATKYIPLWVKVSVAIALGLGTIIGWKRIVVTVGEKIRKSHLTYAQGASAELVAMEQAQICSDCRCPRRRCCPLAWREPWPPTGPVCRWPPCAIS